MGGYVYGVALYRKTISGELERIGFNILPSDKGDEVRVRYGGKMQSIQFRPHELFPHLKPMLASVWENYFFDRTHIILENYQLDKPFEQHFCKVTGIILPEGNREDDVYYIAELVDYRYRDLAESDIVEETRELMMKKAREIYSMEQKGEDVVFGSYVIDGIEAEKMMFTPTHSIANLVNTLPPIDKIIFNNPATIVFWNDGTKTVVKCMKNQEFNAYYGVACTIMKKYFGNNSSAKAFIDRFRDNDLKKTIEVFGGCNVQLGTIVR